MVKKIIKISFKNGLDFQTALRDIFSSLTEDYLFIESEKPDFVVFGPYGNDLPAPGKYTRIGYFCENIKPDMSTCEWAFGIPRANQIKNPRYQRIQWHGLKPEVLIKPEVYDPMAILKQKKHFCNFLYSNKVPFREEFFKKLSKYKKVDAPGRSMRNMANIDSFYKGNYWERKKAFVSEYKFTIAAENYVYPGYQTEKLYDAMQSNSIPIYIGDPFIDEIFNVKSFVNAGTLTSKHTGRSLSWLEKLAQPDFKDYRPAFYDQFFYRVRRKIKAIGRQKKMNLLFSSADYDRIIEQIIELDQQDDQYLQMLSEPWLKDNKVPLNVDVDNRWREIFG